VCAYIPLDPGLGPQLFSMCAAHEKSLLCIIQSHIPELRGTSRGLTGGKVTDKKAKGRVVSKNWITKNMVCRS
jgi:hypothetical protein